LRVIVLENYYAMSAIDGRRCPLNDLEVEQKTLTSSYHQTSANPTVIQWFKWLWHLIIS
jgi:hypothetical protein